MIFPHSFYEDEIRCDYFVTSMVKRSWAAQIQILSELDEACMRAGLEYFAEWGTLLGAIRHGGFIPWDDDLDICMKRKDYNYLIENVSTLLPDGHSIVNFRSNPDFRQMLSRIVSSDHYRFDPEYLSRYSGLPIALGIDIFPLDFMTADEEYEREREERAELVYSVVNEIAVYKTPVSRLEGSIREIEKRCGVTVERGGDVLLRLRMLLESIFGEVDEADAEYITLYPLWMNAHSYRFPAKYYKYGLRMPFENSSIIVPACYDAILRLKYGNSYLAQVRSGGAHEYPYYEKHVDILRDSFGFEWPTYSFKEADLVKGSKMWADDLKGKRALFITYSANAFNNMRSLAGKYLDEGCEVSILPIQSYDIAPDMSGITPARDTADDRYFLNGLEGAKVTRDTGVIDAGFDIIVTNYPYDEYNLITAVDKQFYSSSLRSRTGHLVYVPALEVKHMSADDERAIKLMPSYVCTPMACACDEIVLHSTQMKERYSECLTAMSGESYRGVWEDKITVLSSEEDEPDNRAAVSSSGRKKILFFVGISSILEAGEAAIDKIEAVFRTFDENKDRIEVIYKLSDDLLEDLEVIDPKLYELYMSKAFRPGDDNIDTEEIDAYYGEPSIYATQMINAGKPVMIMQVM